MITNYNYVTNQEQKWYSEQEYNKLKKEFKNERDNINNYIDSDACLRQSDKPSK